MNEPSHRTSKDELTSIAGLRAFTTPRGSIRIEGSAGTAFELWQGEAMRLRDWLNEILPAPETNGELERLREALAGIRQYANDTLSGRVDGPDDRDWQRQGIVEIRNRARDALERSPAEKTSARPVSASDRLHRICDALSEQADKSPFTREEWERIDKETARLKAALDDARSGLEYIRQRYGALEGVGWDRVLPDDDVKAEPT
jgi:hypothetical protein